MKMKNAIIIVVISIIAVLTIGVFAITRNLSYMMDVYLHGINTTALSDGTYTGSFERGRFSNTLTVQIENHTIVGVSIKKDVSMARDDISDDVFNKVIKTQSTDIDAISGATVTTNAYLMAIEDALNDKEK